MRTITITNPGPQSTLQDLGRPGHADIGIPHSGAADRTSAQRANRILGNHENATLIENLLGNLTITTHSPITLAVTGAPTPLHINNTPAPTGTPIYAPTNSTIHLGTPTHGLRTYLAINGGIHAPTTLGSASTNPTASIGPPPLTAGTHLTLNQPTGTPTWNSPPDVTHAWGTPHTARVILGPRDNWFTPQAITTLFTTTWTTTPNLDRIGIRLTGAQLQRSNTQELPSEGTIRGAIQIPPNGQPVIFLADHPTTGGYPVIGVINDTDTDALAQARPGDTIRFTPQPPPFPRDIL